MAFYYEYPSSSLAALIEGVIQDFTEGREQFWSDDPDGQKYIEWIDSLASLIVQASDDLVVPSDAIIDWPTATLLVGHDRFAKEAAEKIEIIVAERFAVGTNRMTERCLSLAHELLQAQPNRSVLRFMRRLSRCYVAGFFPECVMLCRSVLENAVVEVVRRDRVEVPPKEPHRSEMKSRLDALLSRGILSASAHSNAWVVWTRGNKAIHSDPEVTQQAFETIVMTLSILSELYNPQPS